MDELQGLIDRALPPGQSCSAQEYVQEDVPVCVDLVSENWDANFVAELAEPEASESAELDDEEDGSGEEEPVPKVKKFSESLMMLDDVKAFLDSCGCVEEATTLNSVIDSVACAHIRISKQSTLLDYFSPASASTSSA